MNGARLSTAWLIWGWLHISGQVYRHNWRAVYQDHKSQSQENQGQGGLNYGYKDYLHTTRRLSFARFEVARTTKGWNRYLGQAHLRYLKNHRPILYTNLLTSCKLTAYLADIDEKAFEMFDRLVKQLAKQEGMTEKLKAANQMLWVRKMNTIVIVQRRL